MNETQAPILTKPSRRKLQAMQNAEIGRVSPLRQCKNDEAFAATTMQKRWSFRRRDDAKTMKLQAAGFG